MKYSIVSKKSSIKYYKKVKNYVLVCKIFGSVVVLFLIRWVNQDKLNHNFFNNKKGRFESYKIKRIHIDYYKKIERIFNVKTFFEYFIFAFKSCCEKNRV
jgi:hypothetical protein